jgi:hypothetical protein
MKNKKITQEKDCIFKHQRLNNFLSELLSRRGNWILNKADK